MSVGTHLFAYAVIRAVPRVERGEFLNVGVVLLCQDLQYLDDRIHVDAQRLCFLCKTIDIDVLQQHLAAFHAICMGGRQGGPIGELDRASRFRWLTAVRSTTVQTSDVHPGLCTDPAATLDHLFTTLVL
jgi:hypothetical protein